MSSAPDAHGHDAPHTHDFTGEPAHALAKDEPPTPGWLPLVGVALFTVAAIVLLVEHGNADAPPAPAQVAAPAAMAANAVAAAPNQAAQPGQPPRPISPEQMEQMRRNLGRNKGALPPRPAPAH